LVEPLAKIRPTGKGGAFGYNLGKKKRKANPLHGALRDSAEGLCVKGKALYPENMPGKREQMGFGRGTALY